MTVARGQPAGTCQLCEKLCFGLLRHGGLIASWAEKAGLAVVSVSSHTAEHAAELQMLTLKRKRN